MAVLLLREAVELEDAIPYSEPPIWHHPVRQVLGAVLLEAAGAELLKLEYPGSPAGCEAVTAALGVPWAVLSAGVGHEEFCAQLAASREWFKHHPRPSTTATSPA